jgi:hypothetical protein
MLSSKFACPGTDLIGKYKVEGLAEQVLKYGSPKRILFYYTIIQID